MLLLLKPIIHIWKQMLSRLNSLCIDIPPRQICHLDCILLWHFIQLKISKCLIRWRFIFFWSGTLAWLYFKKSRVIIVPILKRMYKFNSISFLLKGCGIYEEEHDTFLKCQMCTNNECNFKNCLDSSFGSIFCKSKATTYQSNYIL